MVNRIRKENKALQTTWNIEILETSNESIIGYVKSDIEAGNYLLIFVYLDAYHTQTAHVNIPSKLLPQGLGNTYTVQDLLSGEVYSWQQGWNYVQLNPYDMPAHILKIETSINN